jgi:hypothetical protein
VIVCLQSEGGGQGLRAACRLRTFPVANGKREVPTAKIDLDALSIEELAALRGRGEGTEGTGRQGRVRPGDTVHLTRHRPTVLLAGALDCQSDRPCYSG